MEAADPALAPISEKITGVTVALEPSELLAAEPTVLTNISIGYARVSTDGQKLERRLDALKAAGCRRTFAEKQSVRDTDRPELTACLEFMAAGDTLVVPSLDRLSRSLQDLITTIGDLRARHRVYLTAREPRHHHPGWPAGVPRLRRPGRVHPRADRLRHPRAWPPPAPAAASEGGPPSSHPRSSAPHEFPQPGAGLLPRARARCRPRSGAVPGPGRRPQAQGEATRRAGPARPPAEHRTPAGGPALANRSPGLVRSDGYPIRPLSPAHDGLSAAGCWCRARTAARCRRRGRAGAGVVAGRARRAGARPGRRRQRAARSTRRWRCCGGAAPGGRPARRAGRILRVGGRRQPSFLR